MFNKRLISMVPQALRYIARNVAAQWVALVANIVLMLLIGLFLQRLFDGAAVDGERVVRDERFKVDRPHGSRAAAALARALGVEGQLLGGRRVKVRAAVGADELLPGGDGERRRQIVPVRAAVAGKP